VRGPVATARDSRDQLAALLGDERIGRESLIEHAGDLALRQGKWKFIPASDGPRKNVATDTELGNDPAAQLYDLDADPGEARNVAGEHPDVVERLRRELDGR
jgi:arylsulfatase A-like enzyme